MGCLCLVGNQLTVVYSIPCGDLISVSSLLCKKHNIMNCISLGYLAVTKKRLVG